MKLSFNPNLIVNWERKQIKFGAIIKSPGTPERHIVCQVRSSANDNCESFDSTAVLLRRFVEKQEEIEDLVYSEVLKGNLRPVIDLSLKA